MMMKANTNKARERPRLMSITARTVSRYKPNISSDVDDDYEVFSLGNRFLIIEN